MPNQREIARSLGLSQATVSLALRGSNLIPEKTRRRVEASVKKLGYSPNPMVSSLMSHIRKGRKVKDQGCLAILVDYESEVEWISFHLAYRLQYQAIREQAAKRGYRTECFFLRAPGMSPEKIDRVLYSRGIVGIILAGPRKDSSYVVQLQWNRYACAKSGYTWESPAIDCVTADNRQHVELAFQKLSELGAKRVGFCISRRMVPRANSNWVAGYLISQRKLSPSHRVPMFITEQDNTSSFSKFKMWIKKWKPDALIGGNTEKSWIEKIPTARKPRIFCSRFHYPETTGPCIEENNRVIGEALCDLVIEQIIHNKRGIPDHPRLILIEGSWVP